MSVLYQLQCKYLCAKFVDSYSSHYDFKIQSASPISTTDISNNAFIELILWFPGQSLSL